MNGRTNITDKEKIKELMVQLNGFIRQGNDENFFACIDKFNSESGINFSDIVNTKIGRSALLNNAIVFGRSDVVNRLIDDFNADVNILDEYKSESPLSCAFRASKGSLSTSHNRLAIINKLLDSGANIHLMHEKSYQYDDPTPYNIALRGAIDCGLDAVELLLKRDQSLDRSGMLRYAVRYSKDPLVVKLFIQENHCQTELDNALGDIFSLLIGHSGMTRIGTNHYPAMLEESAGVIELLLKSGANPNLTVRYKTTDGPIFSLLWIALANRSKNTFLALQLAGAKDDNLFVGRGLDEIHYELVSQLKGEIKLRRNAQLIGLSSLDKYDQQHESGAFSLLPKDLLVKIAAQTADKSIKPHSVASEVSARAIADIKLTDASQRPQLQVTDETPNHLALKNYKNAAALRADDHYKKSFTLFGRTFTGFGKSGKQKKDASKALFEVVYYGKGLETLDAHLPSLRNGELGTIYRKLGF